jgi:DUF4097 and DUF4098 domain-containing protein YvlB
MKSIPSKLALLILLIFGLLFIHCSKKSVDSDDNVDNTDFMATESFSFRGEVENQTQLRLEGINSNIAITGSSETDSVIISAQKYVGSESIQDAQAHLSELHVNVTELANEIFVKTIQPDETHGRNYGVNYEITLPQEFTVLVINVNGGISITSVHESVSVVNVNGQVILTDVSGSASVILVNGQIQAEVTLRKGGTLAMTTVNGGIDLEIPQYTSAEFSASVVNGTITVSNLVLIGEVSTPTSLTGTLGTGEGTITLSTDNGGIYVTGF